MSPLKRRNPRILIIPEYNEYGGTLTFLLKLLDYHQQHQVETAVLIPPEAAYLHVLEAFAARKVRVFTNTRKGAQPQKFFASLFSDIRFVWKAFWSFRPDMILVSEGTYTQLLGVLTYPVPVVFAIHSVPPEKPWKKRNARRFIRLVCVLKKTVFLTVSQYAAYCIHIFFQVPDRCLEVIYNSFRPLPKRSEHPQKPVILTIGHVVYYKNPGGWLEVARRVAAHQSGVQFIWLGDGDLLKSTRQQAAALGLENVVRLEGYTPDVDRFYQQAAIYFQPSLTESHGVSVVEAMAWGLPCVVSDVGGLPESVVDGETGFCCKPDDLDSFAQHILALLNNPDQREQMGRAGQQRAEALFSEKVQQTKIISLYQRLLGRKWTQRSAYDE